MANSRDPKSDKNLNPRKNSPVPPDSETEFDLASLSDSAMPRPADLGPDSEMAFPESKMDFQVAYPDSKTEFDMALASDSGFPKPTDLGPDSNVDLDTPPPKLPSSSDSEFPAALLDSNVDLGATTPKPAASSDSDLIGPMPDSNVDFELPVPKAAEISDSTIPKGEPVPGSAAPLADVANKLGGDKGKKDGDSRFDIDLPAVTASSSHLFGTEIPTAEGLSDTGLVNLEPFVPIQPAAGWFDSHAEEPAARGSAIDAAEADLGAPLSGMVGGSDIFGAPVPPAKPKSDVSDVIAATAYSPAKPVEGEPARGSGVTPPTAPASDPLPLADPVEDSLFGEEEMDISKLAAELGGPPEGGVDASSILADLSEPGSAPGDSSAIRIESPGIEPTHGASDSSRRRFGRASTELDIDVPEAVDWRQQGDSDLFADNRTAPEFELRPESVEGDPFGDELTPGQPPPSSIFSEHDLKLESGSVPVANPESGDAVEFSDHPDPKHADSGSFHVLPAMRGKSARTEEDDWSTAQTDMGPDGTGMQLRKLEPTEEVAPLPAVPVKRTAAKKDSKAVVNWAAAPAAETEEEPVRPAARRAEAASEGVSRRGFAGLALGLLLGVGASAGVYFSGVIPNKEPSSQAGPGATAGGTLTPNPNGTGGGPAVPAPGGDPHEALNGGDPAKALKLLEAGGARTAADKAALGQARLFARFRELAKTNTAAAADDAEIKQARADLEAAMNDPGAASSAEAEKAAVKAALHLGLSHEAAGDRAKAKATYEDGLKKFPKAAEFFQTALDRLTATDTGANRTSRLTPTEAEQLASAVVILLAMDQVAKPADPPAPEPAEAGSAFWKAVNAATAGKYDDAVKLAVEAKATHEKRAKALAGRGLNPLSDPLEQIFPRCCDDLKAYWELRKTLYEHPGIGAAVKKDGVAKTLDALAGAEKRAVDQAKLAADLKTSNDTLASDLKSEKEKVVKAEKDLLAEKDKIVKLEKDVKAEKDNTLKVEKDLKAMLDKQMTDAKKAIEDAKGELAKAKDAFATDQKKLSDLVKAKQSALDAKQGSLEAIAKEFQAGKLLPEKYDDPAIIAAARSTVSRATGPDLTKLIPADLSAVAGTGLTTGHILSLAARTNKADAAAKTAAAEIAKLKQEQSEEIKSMRDLLKKTTEDLKSDHAADLKKAADTLAAEKKKAADTLAAEKKKADTAIAAEKVRADTEAVQKAAAEKQAVEAKHQAENEAAKAVALTISLAAEKARTAEAERLLRSAGGATALVAQDLDRQAREAAARSLDAGIKEFKAGRYAAAAVKFEEAAKHDPNDAIAWYFLGATRWSQGKPDDAKTAYKQGADREMLRLVPAKQIETMIGAIQGPARDALTAARP